MFPLLKSLVSALKRAGIPVVRVELEDDLTDSNIQIIEGKLHIQHSESNQYVGLAEEFVNGSVLTLYQKEGRNVKMKDLVAATKEAYTLRVTGLVCSH